MVTGVCVIKGEMENQLPAQLKERRYRDGGGDGGRRDSGREKMEISQEREKSLGNGASGLGHVIIHVMTESPDKTSGSWMDD